MGIICDEDRALMACLMNDVEDIIATTEVTWFKFDQANTVVDPVYDDARPAFEAGVVLKGVVEFDIQEEHLSKYGTFERGVEDDDIERADVIAELPRYDGGGNPYGITNADEFEIKGRRYHCIGIGEPDEILTGDSTLIVYLIEQH